MKLNMKNKKSLNNRTTSRTISRNNMNSIVPIDESQCQTLDTYFRKSNNKADGLKELGEGTFGITFEGCLNKSCNQKQVIKFA